MSKQITIYLRDNEADYDLKNQISVLRDDNSLPYYQRTESAIARMLLQERLEQVTKENGRG